MKVIPPLDILSGSRLTSSTVTEPSAGETAWVSGSGYALGAQVIRVATHKKYTCILAITAGSAVSSTPPETNAVSTVPSWVESGYSNKFAMFDLLRNTGTTATNTMSIVLTPGQRIDSIAFLGMINVQSLNITATSVAGGGVVWTRSADLNGRKTLSYYQYFFTKITTKDTKVYLDVPPYTDIVLNITLTGSGNITVGACIVGLAEFIGNVQSKATSDILNFSSVTRDSFGNASMVVRRNVPKTNQTLFLEKSNLARVLTVRDNLNATPALWTGLDSSSDDPYFDALLILGFYRTFSIDIDNPIGVYMTLELEEV